MVHGIYRGVSFEQIATFTFRMQFDDGAFEVIDFCPVLKGELYRPPRDFSFLEQVRIDPDVHTLAWLNGATLNPTILHNWPKSNLSLAALAEK
jgi:Protein of unknown function (DUF2442)